jgi:hypothetical protein
VIIDEHSSKIDEIRTIFKGKIAKIGKNTEGVNKLSINKKSRFYDYKK